MSLITINDLSRTFRVPLTKGKGIKRVFKNLFNPEYRQVEALKNLSFEVGAGEFVGYVGPNGAGKSTTMKCLTGILVPSSGEVKVAGYIPWKERQQYTQNIGVMFGQKSLLFNDLPVKDAYTLYRSIYHLPESDFRKSRDELVERFKVTHLLDVPVRKLSLGERMRCELIAALLHQPKILFLDEPSIGLDFNAKREFRDFLSTAHRQKGMTVMLTSHELVEVEALSTRILVLAEGNLVYDGSIDRLRAASKSEQYVSIEFDEVHDQETLNNLTERWCPTCKTPTNWEFKLSRSELPNALAAISKSVNILDIRIKEPPLDVLLAQFYGEKATAKIV